MSFINIFVKNVALFILVTLLIISCESESENTAESKITAESFNESGTNDDPEYRYAKYISRARLALDSISSTDGIDLREAELIFYIYSRRFFRGFLGVGPVIDCGDDWHGIALTHWTDEIMDEKVVIDKKSGAVSWVLGPDVVDYKELLDIVADYPRLDEVEKINYKECVSKRKWFFR